MTYYQQCRLTTGPTDSTYQVAWIPTRYAVVGGTLRLRGITWCVAAVYADPVPENQLPDPHRDRKRIWQATSGDDPRGNK